MQQILALDLPGGLQPERFFATMATSGGWSSIQELAVVHDHSEPLSMMEAEYLASFIIQSEILRTLALKVAPGDETGPIMETLTRTTVESLKIRFREPSTLQNGGRQIATALERCTCMIEL